jgi:DNA (cytosine-5)-methyltransferase 1
LKELRVIDFFCGAGGFSEGFRQQGFDVVMGIDHWRPAVQSHNLNHGLEDEPMDILAFSPGDGSTDTIDALPDTEVIVGSPPCVSFSMANRAGKAEKGLGIRLIESFLRVVAVKKHRRGSKLQAWLMENVAPSRNYVPVAYTFRDLDLVAWAEAQGRNPDDEALRVRDNGAILSAADYGSPQTRQRFVCGEWVADGSFPAPVVTHRPEDYVTLGSILKALPSPAGRRNDERLVVDPNYPAHRLPASEIPDQFYDTGIYAFEWRSARQAKVNHPFMGRMSFPENLDRPARTVMATRSASTREALILKSERKRRGDGEYRLPTVREAATMMGFPLAYQFVGSEGTKWKQIGNAVCPHMSAALAMELRKRMGLRRKSRLAFQPLVRRLKGSASLNDYRKAKLDNPPKRKADAKFRGHPFKDGNLTIALCNHLPGGKVEGEWSAVAYLGAGKTYATQLLHERNLQAAWRLAEHHLGKAKVKSFKRRLAEDILDRVPGAQEWQSIYAANRTDGHDLHPLDLMDILREALEKVLGDRREEVVETGHAVVDKDPLHLAQVLAAVGVCEVAKKASPTWWREHSSSAPRRPVRVQGRLFGQTEAPAG